MTGRKSAGVLLAVAAVLTWSGCGREAGRETLDTATSPAAAAANTPEPSLARARPGGDYVPELVLQLWPSTDVNCLAYSPDGRTVASGSEDGSVRLWDAQSGELLRTMTITGHLAPVTAVAYSPDGTVLAAGNWADEVALWHAGSGEFLRVLRVPSEDDVSVKGTLLRMAYSPDGMTIATGHQGPEPLRLWDVESGTLRRSINTNTDSGGGVALAFSPDGRYLASGTVHDGTIQLWDALSGDLVQVLENHPDVGSVAWSPDGKHIASGGYDGRLRLWDINAQRTAWTARMNRACESLAFSPDGSVLAVGGDVALEIRDAHTGRRRGRIGSPDVPFIGVCANGLAFSPDGRNVAVNCCGGVVSVLSVDPLEVRWRRRALSRDVRSLSFSPDGGTIATTQSGPGLMVRLWDVRVGRLRTMLPGGDTWVGAVSFSPDGELIAWGGGAYDANLSGLVKIWCADTLELVNTWRTPLAWTQQIAFSPDGRTLATCARNVAGWWDVGTGRLLGAVSADEYFLQGLRFSPDGDTLLAWGLMSASAYLWDVPSQALTHELSAHEGSVTDGRFSPDGTEVATACADGRVRLWDAADGALRHTLDVADEYVLAVAYSPDGRLLATASNDRRIQLWDKSTWQVVREMLNRHRGSRILEFSPKGDILAGDDDGAVRLWEVATGREIAAMLLLTTPDAPDETPIDWIVLTPEQHYTRSGGALPHMRWRVGDRLLPGEAYDAEFHSPERVAEALSGR